MRNSAQPLLHNLSSTVGSVGNQAQRQAVDGYLQLLAQLAPSIEGVHLYAPVRPSHQQPTSPLPRQWMERLASDIAMMGIKVHLA